MDGHGIGTSFVPGVHGLGGAEDLRNLFLRPIQILTKFTALCYKAERRTYMGNAVTLPPDA